MEITIKKVIKDYIAMSRYVALGSLDGILTVMSISLTAAIVAIVGGINTTPHTIGLTGLSGGIAICLSNGFGSYVGEKAEETKQIRDLESQMMYTNRELDNTLIHQEAKYRVYLSMFTHGSASLLGAVIPSIPFFVFSDISTAIFSTLVVCFILLIILGCYLGHVSHESKLKITCQIIFIGILIVILSYLMGAEHG